MKRMNRKRNAWLSVLRLLTLFMTVMTVPALAGESYEGDQITFAFSGGSGRTEITCSNVDVEGEEAQATILFAKAGGHGTSSFDAVKVDETEYDGDNTFTIPVELNAYTQISARTLAMSEPHWVDYRIYVSVDGTQPEPETEIDAQALKELRPDAQEETEALSESGKDMQDQTEMLTESAEDAQDEPDDLSTYYSGDPRNAPAIDGLTAVGEMSLDYAEHFSVYLYEGGYKLIDIPGCGQFLIVPEGTEFSGDPGEGIALLQAPVDHVYLAASSAMSLVSAVGALSRVTMTGTQADGWHIPEPVEALENGSMIYAGKYSEPNYEVLVGNDCHLAIESTMIAHAPEVSEMLESIDIPVLVDHASYEADGLGRTEWIKLYGALFGAEKTAFEKFEEQKKIVDDMAGYEQTGKTVAIVSVREDGTCVVRRPDDYIAAMVADAGGIYVLSDDEDLAGGGATVTISMEEFYSLASDADFLVYNGTITGTVDGADALLQTSDLFADFKAYQEGNLWQIDSSLYQSTDKVAQLIRDFHLMLTGGDEQDMVFLSRIG